MSEWYIFLGFGIWWRHDAGHWAGGPGVAGHWGHQVGELVYNLIK